MSYPKWKYHAEKAPVVVASKDEEQALGSSWADSPADLAKAELKALDADKPAPKVIGSKKA